MATHKVDTDRHWCPTDSHKPDELQISIRRTKCCDDQLNLFGTGEPSPTVYVAVVDRTKQRDASSRSRTISGRVQAATWKEITLSIRLKFRTSL